MKIFKKLTAVLLSFIFIFAPLSGVPFELPVFAATGGTTGKCAWTLDGTVLTISGNGYMGNFDYSRRAPWGTSLTEVIIEEGVTTVGIYAFYECKNLTSVSLPDSLISIGDHAFFDCESLTKITIPDAVTTVGNAAFSDCKNLSEIHIGANVSSLTHSSFSGCTALTAITVDPRNSTYQSTGNCLIETASKTLIQGSNTSVIPADGSVTAIGDFAFTGCAMLTALTIPSTVVSIGQYAFRDCTSITYVVISEGVTSIGDFAFYNCKNITDFWLAKSVTAIGKNALFPCPKKIFYAGSPEDLKKITFSGYNPFENQTVYYNCCKEDLHIFSSDCDVDCNTCGRERTANASHSFDTNTGLCSLCSAHQSLVFVYDPIQNGYRVKSCSTNAEGALVIPSFYNNKPVIAIDASAFNACGNLTSVIIPDSVTSIGVEAFSGCYSLTSINIPNDITEIAAKTFSNCSALTTVIIPAGVTVIGSYAFFNCRALSSVIISDSVTTVGESAFEGCYKLTSVKLPNGITEIAAKTFSGCYSLTSVTIPAGVTAIGNSAFSSCQVLTSVSISEGVTSIGDNAFNNCSRLSKIVLPDSITSIGNHAFEDCSSLSSVTMPNSLSYLGDTAFRECQMLTDITIPGGITSIGDATFYHCTSLTRITIPSGVTSIGTNAFAVCSKLAEVNIPSSIKTIKNAAFYSCNSLKTVYFGGSREAWTSILIESNNNPLQKATVSYNFCTNVPHTYSSDCDGECNVCLWKRTPSVSHSFNATTRICSLCSAHNDLTFSYNHSEDTYEITACESTVAGELYLPARYNERPVTAMANLRYPYPKNVTSIYIPDSITRLDSNSLSVLTNLKTICYGGSKAQWEQTEASLNLPKNATIYYNFCKDSQHTYSADCDGACNVCSFERTVSAEHSFDENTHLCSRCSDHRDLIFTYVSAEDAYSLSSCSSEITGHLIIPSQHNGKPVVALSSRAFQRNPNLTLVTVPETVTDISDAFYVCTALSSIEILGNLTKIGASAFSGCRALTEITIPASVTSIGNSAFYNCRALTKIKLPASVTSIGNSAFSNCIALAEISIPDSVTSIGSSAFSGCNSLTKFKVPTDVTSINDKTFYGCRALTEITIPASVTSIGNSAFQGCIALTEINLPAGITSIGSSAFSECKVLAEIDLPAALTSIGENAFEECASLTEIKIPAAVTSIGESVFLDCNSLISITVDPKNPVFHSAGNCLIETESKTLLQACNTSVIPSDGSVTSIGQYAFCRRSALTEIAIPKSVTFIGQYAFYGCTSLTEIFLPNDLTSIEDNVFGNCSALTRIIIPKSVTSIGSYAFSNCKALAELHFSDSVTTIGPLVLSSEHFLFHIWFEGTEESRNAINVDENNAFFKNATWHYVDSLCDETCNTCDKTRSAPHLYDSTEDLLCKLCGVERDHVHTYDNACDPSCNDCGAGRTVPDHVYDNACDPTCNACGAGRTVPDHVYDAQDQNDNAHWNKCSLCGAEEEGTRVPHFYDNDCDTTCNGCAHSRTVDHVYDNACDTTCNDCGAGRTVPDHVYDAQEHDDETHWNKCSVCGIEEDGSRMPHGYDNALDATCNNCSYTRTVAPAYTYTVENGEATITDVSPAIEGDIVIPSTLDGYPVTAIGSRAFTGCRNLTRITVPDSVTFIGEYAFNGCSALTSVHLGKGITSFEKYLFVGCNALTELTIAEDNPKYHSDGNCVIETKTKTLALVCKNFVIPTDGSVTSIGDYAIAYSSALTEIAIPDGITSIGIRAFYACDALSRISLPNSLTKISTEAFSYCSALTEISIPSSVTSIGVCAFDYCSSLATLYIDAPYVSSMSFFRCYALTSVHLGKNVTNLSTEAFSLGLVTEITVAEDNPKYHSDGNCVIETNSKTLVLGCKNFVIPTDGSVEIIGNYAFNSHSALTEITIPDFITEIGFRAFESCHALESVRFGNGITSIKSSTFSWCDALKSVTIPDSVAEIGEDAFNGCSALTSLHLGKGVTSIGSEAFLNCSALSEITVAKENPTFHSDGNCLIHTKTKVLLLGGKNSVIPTDGSVTFIGQSAFYNCKEITEIAIPHSITSIGQSAFSGCTNLSQVWYVGTAADRDKITIGQRNNSLQNATWHFVDNACDTTCNDCGATRSVPDHVYSTLDHDDSRHWRKCSLCGIEEDGSRTPHNYTHGCDSTCNDCGFVRTPSEHGYTNACDPTCNVCGEVRTVSHNYSLTEQNDTAHWRKCAICGIEEDGSRMPHGFDNDCDPTCNVCSYSRPVDHVYDDEKDITCNICGYEKEEVGDLDFTKGVTLDDAIYLLFHLNFPYDYPVNQSVDFDGNGTTDLNDAIYLLFHVFFPERFTLHA